MSQIELLAPVGSKDALNAAIAAGSNAVYMAGNKFGARAYANNFSNEDLIEAIKLAHIYQVRVYITVNTLLYDDEIEDILNYIAFLYNHDVDAVIVQDIGLLYLIKKYFPDLEVHASTQMSIHNLEGAQWIEQQGVARIVLARENTIDEIRFIKSQVKSELEIFVHGALCVSYSGQCLMSGLIGGRSGNRGRCAQPCRKKYTLVRNKEVIEQNRYMISPKDLNTIEHVGELIEAGVTSFKIEGRMKSPEYVAIVVSKYRKAIDSYLKHKQVKLDPIDHVEIEQIFNRGFTKGFLFKQSGNAYINLDKNNNTGRLVGEVIQSSKNKVNIRLVEHVIIGDGLFFDSIEYGTTVSRLFIKNQQVTKADQNAIITLDVKPNIPVGTRVFKMTDVMLHQKAQDVITSLNQRIPIHIEAIFKEGQSPMLIASDLLNNKVATTGDILISQAKNQALTYEMVLNQLSKLKDTPYYIQQTNINIDPNVFVPMGVINNLRRDVISQLNTLRENFHRRQPVNIELNHDFSSHNVEDYSIELSVYVRTLEQLEVALNKPVQRIYVDEDLIPNIELNDSRIYVTTKRINHHLQLNKFNNKSLMISNLGDLQRDNIYKHTNFNFNVTNSYSIDYLVKQGINQVTLSIEMNQNKLKDLKYPQKDKIELIIYGYLESMITKHCVFKANCQNQCKASSYVLQDSLNEQFPIYMDQTCHMHILNSKRLILNEELNSLIKMGYKQFRLQFTLESGQETEKIIDSYIEKLLMNNANALDRIIENAKNNNDYTRGFYNKDIK